MAARGTAVALGLLALGAFGCRQDMHDQPKYKAFRRSDFFGDERSARPALEDTVARGQLREDAAYFTGKRGTVPIDVLPVALTPALLRRGQERFSIYCTPCHGQTGRGDGMVVQRGYRRPPSFHIDRLRNEKAGYFYDVITSGFGAMPDYSAQVPVADRWAIVAYLRALQLSENARVEDVPPERRAELDAGPRLMPAPAETAAPPHPASAPPPSARPVPGGGPR
jgi:mono/diheme cytochrome c family protein